jgi:hypothetical protein
VEEEKSFLGILAVGDEEYEEALLAGPNTLCVCCVITCGAL